MDEGKIDWANAVQVVEEATELKRFNLGGADLVYIDHPTYGKAAVVIGSTCHSGFLLTQ